MNLHKNAPLIIRCDDTQMKISHREYVICQHQAGLGTAHLGFTALLYGKISMLVFASSGLSERSLAFEEINDSFRVFPNGRRDLACDISKWEIEAIDGLIMDCMLGRYAEEVNIDTELSNIYGRVNLVFTVSDFFL